MCYNCPHINISRGRDVRFCIFVVLFMTALSPVTGAARAQDTVLQDIPVFKGRVVTYGASQYGLVGCGFGEWDSCDFVTPADLGVTELQMLVWATRATTILIYGKWEDDPLAITCFREVEDVKVTAGCESLAHEGMSWGSLKAAYR